MVVALPQAVDMTDVALDPGEGCGDDADSAARGFRVEVSSAGTAGPWTAVAEGSFTDADRHRLATFAARAAGVRAVRLSVLSNQGGGSFFDVSELIVHGAPPVAAGPPPSPPAAPPAPAPAAPAAPRGAAFTLPASGRRTVRFKVRCAVACRVKATLKVDRATARRLGLGRKLSLVTFSRSAKAGTTTFTLRLPSKARRVRSFRARLAVSATYPGAKAVSRSRQLTIKGPGRAGAGRSA
jgi:hypothetical protein